MRILVTKRKGYRRAVEKARKSGHLIEQWDDEFLYTTLSKTMGEFKKMPFAALYLHKVTRDYLCKAKITYNESKRHMDLGDIIVEKLWRQNRGYGTKVLQSLIKICSQLGVESMTGELHGHIEKLEHFYKKNGFVVDAKKRKIEYKFSR